MAIETGNQTRVSYIKEVTFGTTPATPTGQILRFTGFTLAPDGNYLKNPELRTDRQEAAGRRGVTMAKGDLSGVLSYGTYDDLMESVLSAAWTANVVKVGTTRKSFSFERAHLVNGLYFPFTGVVCDSMELDLKANANVGIKFGLIAATVGTEAAATIWSATSAVNTNDVVTTWVGSVKKGGSAIAGVSSCTLRVDNAFQEAMVVGSASLYDLQPGPCKVSGSMEIFFADYALYTDWRAENSLVLQINIGSGSAKSYQIDLSNARITKFGAPSTTEGLTTVQVEFEAFSDVTNTSIKITRIP